MAGMTTSFANTVLALIFNATTSATLASAAGGATNLYVSLHTADPGATGNQTTNEATGYTGYARVTIARSSGGWTVTNNSVSPAANITFPTCTGGSATATFWGIGLSSSGVGTLLMTGAISPSIAITTGTQPVLTTSSTVVES